MPTYEPAGTHVNYDGWICGGCDGPLDPDGLCPACYLNYALHCEAVYVDPYERMADENGDEGA